MNCFSSDLELLTFTVKGGGGLNPKPLLDCFFSDLM